MEFIAEIGLNYNANKGLISEMVRLASISGADFAKLQLGWRDKKGEINHLTKDDLESFIDICSYYQIEPLFSSFHFFVGTKPLRNSSSSKLLIVDKPSFFNMLDILSMPTFKPSS